MVLVVGLFLIIMNWMIVYSIYVKKQHSSWVPLLGGLFCLVGLAGLPIEGIEKFWWVPLTIDYGCFPVLVQLAWSLAIGKRKKMRG